MILHMLCLLMMLMMVNSVISAPGQMDSMEQARKNESKPSTHHTFDPLGGGYLNLKVDSLDPEPQNFRSLEMFVHYQDDIPQNMVLISRREKRRSSSGTLDSLGGGNILKIVDSDLEADIFRSLESLLANQEDFRAREEKQKPSSSGTLDPIGGGNLVRIVEPEMEKEFLASLQMSRDIQADIARQDNKPSPKTSSSGTLDPLGGGNLVRATDPEADEGVFRSNEPSIDNQDDAAREYKTPSPRPSSSGTLDSIGGGHLLGAPDTDADVTVFRLVEPLVDSQVRQNMMRLAREDKLTQRSSHALDSLGGGRLTGLVDPSYRGPIYRSHLVNSLDQGGDVLRMLDSMSGSELLSSLDSAEGMAVLSALRKTHTKYPKRMLDSVSGWAFGESKRNFDEIDNVGFTGFAKRSPYYAKQLALAKKNFDEIDRAGFETYNKRDFDEIDRTGFETFDKRDRKE